MDLTQLLAIAVLAAIDSLSIGTLVVPILLLVGGARAGTVVSYLVAIAAFYFAVGVAISLGVVRALRPLGDVVETDAFTWVQLVVGIALFIAAFVVSPERLGASDSSLDRWRARIHDLRGGGAVIVLALGAGLAEVATMAPYLGAMGLLASADAGVSATVGVLAGYVVVMCVPALVLVAVRASAGARVDPALERAGRWLVGQVAETIPWVLGIVGWIVAGDAAQRLFG